MPRTLLYCLVIATSLAFTTNTSHAQEWMLVQPEGNHFAARFPTKPVTSTETVETAVGDIVFNELTTGVRGGRVSYSLVYNDYPEIVLKTPTRELLDGGRNGALRSVGGTVLSEVDLNLNGHPGREFTISTEHEGHRFLLHTRVFLVGSRMYQLQVSKVDDEPLDISDVVRFFGSFEAKSPRLTEAGPAQSDAPLSEKTEAPVTPIRVE